MKTILIPIDFSKNSINALHYGIELAKAENISVTILHVFRLVYSTPDVTGENLIRKASAEENKQIETLKKMCDEIRKSKKVKCEYTTKYGLVVEVILETIEKTKPDLVIMGTKGASGIQEILIGSNTAKVIEKSKSPVIAVPEIAPYGKIKKIVFATEYHGGDFSAVKMLTDIARPFHAAITILHITDEEYLPDAEEDLLESFTLKAKKKTRYENLHTQLITAEDPEKELERYIEKNHIDLLAVSTKYRNLLETMFGSSLTKKLAYHSTIPVIVFHYKNRKISVF